MPFYAFRLDNINIKFQRGKIPDNDLVTFGVFVNQLDRGHGAATFNDLVSGADTPAGAVPPNAGVGITSQWIISPMEIAPGDGITIVYSGTNISDWELGLSTSQQDQLELKILGAITNAVIGVAGLGDVAAAVGGVLGFAGDPIGKLLGVKAQGPCDGLVFSDAVQFTGSGLAGLTFGPPTSPQHIYESWPNSIESSFTRYYTDEATHDTSVCGQVAETYVLFSVLQVAWVSVKYYFGLFHNGVPLSSGLRQFVTPSGSAFSLRTLMRLRA